jgi:hypothetical protein
MRIRRVDWSEQAEKGLRVSAGEDMDFIRREVQAGIAILWRCESPTNSAYAVTRCEPGEVVIVCGEGSGLKEFGPYFIAAAKSKGLGIRTHVKRRGLIRIWRGMGLELGEYILRG